MKHPEYEFSFEELENYMMYNGIFDVQTALRKLQKTRATRRERFLMFIDHICEQIAHML